MLHRSSISVNPVLAMDQQGVAFTPNKDIWRLHSEMLRVQQTQVDHAERLARLERRQDEDARVKSVWGASSPFPSVLGGTPQQGNNFMSQKRAVSLMFHQFRFNTHPQRPSPTSMTIKATCLAVCTWTPTMNPGGLAPLLGQTACDSTRLRTKAGPKLQGRPSNSFRELAADLADIRCPSARTLTSRTADRAPPGIPFILRPPGGRTAWV